MIPISELQKQIENIHSLDELEIFFKSYMGKDGILTAEFKRLATMSLEEKKSYGQELSTYKEQITTLYENKKNILETEQINATLQHDMIDRGIDTPKKTFGHYSLHTKVRRQIEDIFASLGFHIDYGHDIVTKRENFESVNIPLTHPATEMHDTFYLDQKDTSGQNLVLRTHNSAHQVETMKHYGVPLKVCTPGKVYRSERTDATHDSMFQYVEGLVIDKNMSIAHFKDIITTVLSAVFEKEVEIRMRPAYFPFTEPGFEIDARYDIVEKDGTTYKSKRLEILGAGMVHPNVLRNAGLDPNERQGFAFGLGMSRMVAVKYAIKDIRLFTNGDLRFVQTA